MLAEREVHDEPAALAGSHRRNAPWANGALLSLAKTASGLAGRTSVLG